MSQQKVPKTPDLADVEPGSDADATPVAEQKETQPGGKDAAAMPQGRKPGPAASPVQVRNAGEASEAGSASKWDEQDEAVDESFPASDPSAKY